MAIDVTTMLKGPALVKYDGATFYSKGDISFSTAHNTMNIEVDRYGKVDERVTDDIITVSFTPAGERESLGVVYPYLPMPIGSYITHPKTTQLHSFPTRRSSDLRWMSASRMTLSRSHLRLLASGNRWASSIRISRCRSARTSPARVIRLLCSIASLARKSPCTKPR